MTDVLLADSKALLEPFSEEEKQLHPRGTFSRSCRNGAQGRSKPALRARGEG